MSSGSSTRDKDELRTAEFRLDSDRAAVLAANGLIGLLVLAFVITYGWSLSLPLRRGHQRMSAFIGMGILGGVAGAAVVDVVWALGGPQLTWLTLLAGILLGIGAFLAIARGVLIAGRRRRLALARARSATPEELEPVVAGVPAAPARGKQPESPAARETRISGGKEPDVTAAAHETRISGGKEPESPAARETRISGGKEPESPAARETRISGGKAPESPAARETRISGGKAPESPAKPAKPASPAASTRDHPPRAKPASPAAKHPNHPPPAKPASPAARNPNHPPPRRKTTTPPTRARRTERWPTGDRHAASAPAPPPSRCDAPRSARSRVLAFLLAAPASAVATRAAARPSVAFSAALDGQRLGLSSSGDPIVLDPDKVSILAAVDANTTLAPLTVRQVQIRGKAFGITLLAYDVTINAQIAPGERTRGGRARSSSSTWASRPTGCSPRPSASSIPTATSWPRGTSPSTYAGSATSLVSVFALVVAIVTVASIAVIWIAVGRRKLPRNRWRRGLRFALVGVGVGVTLTLFLSLLLLVSPSGSVWIPLLLVPTMVLFLLGWFSPGPLGEDLDEDEVEDWMRETVAADLLTPTRD